MVHNYSVWLVALVFCLVSACSGNDVVSSNHTKENNGSAEEDASSSTQEDVSTQEDAEETPDLCALVDCFENSSCDAAVGQCVCDEGYDLGTDEAGNTSCIDRCVVMRCGPNTNGCKAGVCLCADGFEANAETGACEPVPTGLCKDREEPCQKDATCHPETGECVCDFGEQELESEESGAPVCKGICDAMRCALNSTCDPDLGTCVCNEGFEMVEDEGCMPVEEESCVDREEPCQENASCRPETGKCVCDFGENVIESAESGVVVCKGICAAMRCAPNSTCDPDLEACVCNEGFEMDEEEGCVPV